MGDRLQEQLPIPYASDFALGAARTPIGILLFACSHLLLGSVLLLFDSPFLQRSLKRGQPDGELLFAVVVFCAAIPMVVGGAALLFKGTRGWATSVVSFALLALAESIATGYGFGFAAWRLKRRDETGTLAGIIMGSVIALMLVLCLIVLRYLSRPKARHSFGLPPGETHAIYRWLPLVMLACGVLIIAGGIAVGSLLP